MFTFKVDLTKDKIVKALILFAIPMFIANVFQQLYNTMDTMIVGNFLGDASLAAIGAASAIYELLIGFALGVGNGLSIVTARCFGAGDEDALKRSVAGSIVIGIGLTIVIMLLAVFSLYPLLELLNTPADIIEEAYQYIFIVTIFVGVMFAYNLSAGLLRAIGNSFMPLVFLIISSVINVVLDIVFITQFSMGIAGAAVATVIAQAISAILCFLYIYKKCHLLIPSRKHFTVGKEMYQELAGQGFSMGMMMAIVSAGTVILQTAINDFGYLIIAGHTTARKINSFCMMPAATLSMALSTFVSQNKGADQKDRIRQGVKMANLLSVAWGAIAIIIMIFLAKPMVAMISGSSEATVLDNGALYLIVNAPFYAVLGILLNLRNSLQGLGRKVIPLVSSIIEFIGKIIFVIALIPMMKYFGVILCEPIIWCCMCLQLWFAFYRDPYMKERKQIQQK